jgi:hypothetical protein
MNAPDTSIPIDEEPGQAGRTRLAVLVRLTARLCMAVFFAVLTGWAALAVFYSNLPAALRPVAALAWVAASAYLLLGIKRRWKGRLAFAASFAAVVAWWLAIPPSNDRDWQPDLAVLPWAEVAGNRVTVRNIRWCDYRSETDFTVRHYDRTFDLDKLVAADLYIVHWGSPHIAHTMMSFGFEDGKYLCFSIETRKEKGEDYSTVKGFFKQYELTYVAADERDLVRLRTNFRGEQVRVYRLQVDPATIRGVFLGYIRSMTSLRDQPEWYNALTGNCTTNIRGHTLPYAGNKRWNWRFLVNGHLNELIYERGAVDRSLPLAELTARSLVNARALTAGDGEDFSQRIREGVPGMQGR